MIENWGFNLLLRIQRKILSNFIPQRRGSSEPSPRGPFGLSALFHFMLLVKFWLVFPRNPSHLLCGGWWVVVGGAYFGLFSKRRIINHKVWRIFYIERKLLPVGIDLSTYSFIYCLVSQHTMMAIIKFLIANCKRYLRYEIRTHNLRVSLPTG